MTNTEFQEAKDKFLLNYKSIEKNRKLLYKIRDKFTKYFTKHKIKSLDINEYIEGKQNKNSFCYGLEWTLDGLGRITGPYADKKFGLYYSKKKGKYIFLKKFGKNHTTAFESIKKEIINLIDAGKNNNINAIISNKISPLVKGKILSVYFPDQYLNVFDDQDLFFFLKLFNIDTKQLKRASPVIKRMELVKFKNSDPDMKNWSLDMFGHFLYLYFHPIKEKDQNPEEVYQTIDHYEILDHLTVDFNKNASEVVTYKAKGSAKKPDYEKDAKRRQRMGERGEKIVIDSEIDRLKVKLNYSESEAREKVVHVSKKNDSAGYDIESLNDDNTTRYIEVKATSGKPGDMSFYYTANEYQTAKEKGNDYYLYIVYEVKTEIPKIWRIQNPFRNKQINMKPIQYKVELFTKQNI